MGRNGCELVKNLNTDSPAAAEELLGLVGLRTVIRESR